MELNRTPNELDRNARNKENENWDKIEGNLEKIGNSVNDFIGTVTSEVVNELVDKAKLDWKEPVNNFNSLPTNAEVGETRMTKDNGNVYRYNGTDWEYIQQIDAGPVNELDSRLTSQLNETDNYSFKDSLNNHKKQRGMFLVIDDDGAADVYNKLKPIAEDYGIPITSAIVPSFIIDGHSSGKAFDGPALTIEQMRELQSIGFEFVSHTWSHPRLADLTESEILEELKSSLDWLQENGFGGRAGIIYPYGSHDDRVMKIARTMYKSGVAVDSGLGKTVYPPIDTYRIRRVFDTYGVQKAKDAIDEAKNNNGLVIWGTHVWYDTWSESDTREIIEYALQEGLEIVTLEKALQEFGNLIEIPSDDVPILVGADGKGNIRQTVIMDKYDEHTIDSPLTDFKRRYITITPITYREAQNEGYPVKQGGIMTTYHIADSNYTSYQVIEPITINSTNGVGKKGRFIRFWVNNQWTEFEDETPKSIKTEIDINSNNWSGKLYLSKTTDGVVSMYGKLTVGNVSAGTIIGNIPSDYRPPNVTPFLVYRGGNEPTTHAGMFISNSGNVVLRLPASSELVTGNAIDINFTFKK